MPSVIFSTTDFKIVGATAAEIKEFGNMLAYLEKSPTAVKILNEFKSKNINVYLNSKGDNAYVWPVQSKYGVTLREGYVKFDLYAALRLTDSTGALYGLNSPALIFIHEIYHAIDPNLKANTNDTNTINRAFPNMAEFYATINGSNAVGKELGEIPRLYYFFETTDPLTRVRTSTTRSATDGAGSLKMDSFGKFILKSGLSGSSQDFESFTISSTYDDQGHLVSINQTWFSSDKTITISNNIDGTVTQTIDSKFVKSTQLIGFSANGSETQAISTQVANSSPSSIDHSQGGLIDSANVNVQVAPSMVDFEGNNNAATYTANSNASRYVTNYYRPFDGNIANPILPTAQQAQAAINLANMSPAAEQQAIQNIQTATANFLNNGSTNSSSYQQMTDPLVLDLNGDGVKLTQFLDDPVMFDIDNDGGSLEQTGWVSKQDGIVVVDRNANGKIDNISETLSEYYGGAVGTDGSAGTKPFKDGFVALKSLDSNNDNLFNNSDATWGTVKVWVDDNHDGKSWKDTNGNGLVDAGEASELKTLTALGISQINLINQAQSGEVRDGNEILARGTFTQNGTSKEALAVNFLANPNGGTTTASGAGGITSTQIGTGNATIKAYTTTSLIGENINVTSKGVTNAAGGRGNDTLTGDGNNNWLAGGTGSDVFNAGAGNDVLLIDADDLQTNINAGAGDDIVQVVGDRGITLNMSQAGVEQVQGGRGADVIIGGGRSPVFVRGGDGNDMIIGVRFSGHITVPIAA